METKDLVENFLERHKWSKLLAAQAMCLDQGILDSEDNFLVIAPTGGGKTGVSELVIHRMLDHDPPKRVLYIAPLKALVESNLDEFRQHFAGRKVMHLREKNALRDGEVVVASNEPAYRAMLTNREMIENFSAVVLDELHVMYQGTRGHTVEKILTLAKKMRLRIICLSATIENKEELRAWLDAVLVEVPESQRLIQLTPHDFPKGDFVATVLKFNKPPVLIFRATRAWAESLASDLAAELRRQRGAESHLRLDEVQTEMESRMSIDITEGLKELSFCLSNGVAWYHSTLPPGVRDYILELYAARKIDFIVTTSALAYGFDSPTRTVVVYDLVRPAGDNKMESIAIHEFRQMAGRAGRPSKAEFNDGFVCGVTKSAGDQKALLKYRSAKLEAVKSHLGTVDDYYQKAIMEFVYAGYESVQEIADILAQSFYRSKGSPGGGAFGLYDPIKEINRHVTALVNADYVYALPGDLLRLSHVGKFIVDFQLDRFESFDLRVFAELSDYVKKFPPGLPIPFDSTVVYNVAKITGAILPSNRRALPQQTGLLLAKHGWKQNDSVSRTSLAIFYGWLDLMAVGDIETRFGVQAEAIETVSHSLARNGFYAFLNIAKLAGSKLNPAYDRLEDALGDGVPIELVPLANVEGIGRKRAEALVKACDALVINLSASVAYGNKPDGTPLKRKDKAIAKKGDRITGRNCLDFLGRYLSLYGEEETKSLLMSEHGIGPVIARNVLELLKG